MPRNFAIYLGWELVNILQSVVTYDNVEGDTVEIITQAGDSYNVPIKDIRKIVSPEYMPGDKVSLKDHPQIIGFIYAIGYYFKTKNPYYIMIIDGKRKSKRYFSKNLIRQI